MVILGCGAGIRGRGKPGNAEIVRIGPPRSQLKKILQEKNHAARHNCSQAPAVQSLLAPQCFPLRSQHLTVGKLNSTLVKLRQTAESARTIWHSMFFCVPLPIAGSVQGIHVSNERRLTTSVCRFCSSPNSRTMFSNYPKIRTDTAPSEEVEATVRTL